MTTDIDPQRPGGRTELGRALVAAGVLTPEWAAAYAQVPRAAFLPELIWPFDMVTGRSIAVRRRDDSRAWQAYADADVPIVTQWDDGRHRGDEPGEVSTSSASMPSVVLGMLRDLDVRPGDRVLEIGTGTGWNAALLAHRLGAGNVVTVEVDTAVATAARAALERCGLPARVVAGDGADGHAEAAPYDRIIATCAVRRVPPAWVRQCRPGGVIVVPWGTHYGNGDAIARLVVAGDGSAASGAFTGPVEFMKLRAQRFAPAEHSAYVPGSVADGDASYSALTEEESVTGRFSPQRFALGVRMPDCWHVVADKAEGARAVWFYGLSDRSWACAQFRDGAATRVWQWGPRRLWDAAEAAHRWWEERGRPDFTRFGLTVDEAGERVWLDAPENPVLAG